MAGGVKALDIARKIGGAGCIFSLCAAPYGTKRAANFSAFIGVQPSWP